MRNALDATSERCRSVLVEKPVEKPKQQDAEVIYTFRADAETIDALHELEAAVSGTGMLHGRRRSTAIRRALIEARARLRANSKL